MGDVAFPREPVVAGRFYPGTQAEADRAVKALYADLEVGDRAALGVMCPHAGWIYSGALAARTLASVRVPPRVVILCPNHTGRGARVAVSMAPSWRTPVGDVAVDRALGAVLLDELDVEPVRGVAADEVAHAREHAIEVLVPLLAARQPALQLVPVVLGALSPTECRRLGAAIARAWARAGLTPGVDVMLVASSDMSHFEDERETVRRDRLALAALATGDPGHLLDVVDGNDISMCGARPAAVLLACAAELGAGRPELVGYTTSAPISGDTSRVVGYAGAIVAAPIAAP